LFFLEAKSRTFLDHKTGYMCLARVTDESGFRGGTIYPGEEILGAFTVIIILKKFNFNFY